METIGSGGYPLPKVKSDIGKSVYRDRAEAGADNYMVILSGNIDDNNSELAGLVLEFMEGMELNDREREIALWVLLITHELLRKQGEADRLNRSLGKD